MAPLVVTTRLVSACVCLASLDRSVTAVLTDGSLWPDRDAKVNTLFFLFDLVILFSSLVYYYCYYYFLFWLQS
jgi:hypothetical protein